MTTLVPARTVDECADAALVAVHAFLSFAPGSCQAEPAEPEGAAVIIRDVITSLLHLADGLKVPGDREALTHSAYCRYREEAAYERLAEAEAL
ncbi:hypothetical protein P3T35_000497 [Kitasatospora sp. GP30]|uniref:hypothetical protein n=1 Tax=Kitasatospora sp. GP30 TaxID=3035084 RepID=UPI000C710F9D|nr:hypothetical protein [Kitasatospora sp. GP30]MDH6138520.1 hypothetical protein [Kitasatospora sp. GP30]